MLRNGRRCFRGERHDQTKEEKVKTYVSYVKNVNMIFDPELILNNTAIKEKKSAFALIVLNRPILLEKNLVVNLWNHCE
jgi:hypothetical protein